MTALNVGLAGEYGKHLLCQKELELLVTLLQKFKRSLSPGIIKSIGESDLEDDYKTHHSVVFLSKKITQKFGI